MMVIKMKKYYKHDNIVRSQLRLSLAYMNSIRYYTNHNVPKKEQWS